MEPRVGEATFEGKRIWYEKSGEGPAVVFVHAAVLDSRMWDDQVSYFSRSHTVLRYDLLGFGKSDRIESPVSRRQELFRVLESTSIRQAVLVGSSYGGEIVLDAALERPEIAAGLVLVSAVPGGFEMQGEPPKELMEMMSALETGDLDRASDLQMQIFLAGPFRTREDVAPLVLQKAGEINRQVLSDGAFGITFAHPPNPLDPPASKRLSQITVPTLIVAGELDNPEIVRVGTVTAKSIPGAEVKILPGGAHLLNLEIPQEFNRTLDDFLLGVNVI